MAISDLQAGQGKVNLTAKVTDVGDPREFQKFGSSGKVANATIEDDSGKMTLTLWNEQVDQVKQGDNVKIENGYVKEWQGEKQISTGRFGTLEVISGEEAPAATPAPTEPAAESKPVEKEVTPEEFDEIEFEEEYLDEEKKE